MSDSTIQAGENSPEQVAFKLLQVVAYVEGKSLAAAQGGTKPDRKWVLETYVQCLTAVKTRPSGTFKVESIPY
jgi:hypothetical protein